MDKLVVFATSFLDKLDTHPDGEGRGKSILDDLEQSGVCTVEYRCTRDPRTPLAPADLDGVTAVIADLELYEEHLLSEVGIGSGGSLRLIARYGVGTNSVDIASATRHGILVANTPGANSIPTAEWSVATILDVAGRRIPHHRRSSHGLVKEGRSRLDVSGRTLGVIGTGRVGRNVIRLMSGFGMTVIACDIAPDAEWAEATGVTYVTLDELCRRADIITLHTSSTEEVVTSRHLDMMKPTAALINCARGYQVDNEAAYAAVKDGRLFGYGLDEIWNYEQLPLDGLNITVSPHIGSDTDSGKAGMQTMSAEAVRDYLQGDRPEFVVNPEVLVG